MRDPGVRVIGAEPMAINFQVDRAIASIRRAAPLFDTHPRPNRSILLPLIPAKICVRLNASADGLLLIAAADPAGRRRCCPRTEHPTFTRLGGLLVGLRQHCLNVPGEAASGGSQSRNGVKSVFQS